MSDSVCVIPARLGSSRYPNKPLAPILGKPMLFHVAKRCLLEPVFKEVVVATCDQQVIDYCQSIGVMAVMTSDRHERASDRVQEAVQILEKKRGSRFASVTMVQGDEPMVTPAMLKAAIKGLATGDAPVVNLMSEILSEDEFLSPNCVKVVTDLRGYALYFSREPIPSPKKFKGKPKAHKQVCIIPFERNFLDEYSALKPTYLEEVESVDMMRVLEHGKKVFCVPIAEQSYPVDVPEDILRVEAALKDCPFKQRYMHG